MASRKKIRAYRIEKTLLFLMVMVMGVCAAYMIITANEPITRDADSIIITSPARIEPQAATALANTGFTDTGYLALVNHNHAVRAQPSHDMLVSAWPTVAVSRVDGMYLHPSALRAVSELFASAQAAGVEGLFVTSGFRGVEHQAQLYNGGANGNFVMPPGHSEHHTGLAVDIMAMGIGQFEFGDSAQGQWLGANSYRYGLILRYPEGAEHITGIAFEPWHFRYVGRVHAYIMRREGLVLEEYIQLIKDEGSIQIEKNGKSYLILFQADQNDTINLPAGMEFTISSTNTAGYIVKAW